MCSRWPRQIWHFLFTGIKLLPPNLRGQHPLDNTFIHSVFALWRGSGNSIWGRLAQALSADFTQVLCADWFYQYAKTYTESINLVFFFLFYIYFRVCYTNSKTNPFLCVSLVLGKLSFHAEPANLTHTAHSSNPAELMHNESQRMVRSAPHGSSNRKNDQLPSDVWLPQYLW